MAPAPATRYGGHGPRQRVFVESDDGEFFGLNTTIFRTDGVLGGLYKKLANYYDDSAKVCLYWLVIGKFLLKGFQDYLSGVYSDALDDYLGGIIQASWLVNLNQFNAFLDLTCFLRCSACGLVPVRQPDGPHQRSDARLQWGDWKRRPEPLITREPLGLVPKLFRDKTESRRKCRVRIRDAE